MELACLGQAIGLKDSRIVSRSSGLGFLAAVWGIPVTRRVPTDDPLRLEALGSGSQSARPACVTLDDPYEDLRDVARPCQSPFWLREWNDRAVDSGIPPVRPLWKP